MNTATATTVEQLQEQKSQKLDQFWATRRDEAKTQEECDTLLKEVKDLETQIVRAKQAQVLRGVNAEQGRLRALALQAWEAEQPDTDITCNDGSFHSTKVKKYPKLAAIQYCRAKWSNEAGAIIEMRINGERFYMHKTTYENKATTYTRPETFEDFLRLNNIMIQDMQADEYQNLIDQNAAINAKFEEAVKAFDDAKSKLGVYSLSCWKLFSQQNAGHIYKFEPRS